VIAGAVFWNHQRGPGTPTTVVLERPKPYQVCQQGPSGCIWLRVRPPRPQLNLPPALEDARRQLAALRAQLLLKCLTIPHEGDAAACLP
jgi:hypothetical protein